MLAGENNQPSILMGLGVSQAAIMYYKFLYSIVAPDSLAGPYSPYYVQVITSVPFRRLIRPLGSSANQAQAESQ